jgi:hypothetical protein
MTTLVVCGAVTAGAQEHTGSLVDAQQLFYNARYEESVAVAGSLERNNAEAALAIDDVQASALLFQIKRLLAPQKRVAASDLLKRCSQCPDLLKVFALVNARGQAAARARLAGAPHDEIALFYVGKFDLNYLWLQLGPLAKKTGWNEFWEARRSLDALLKLHPDHVRARVARAWMEYIVDTKLPWGTEWIMGGGDRKKALTWVRDAAGQEAETYARVEAQFALWEMLIRERKLPEAVGVATRLAVSFPENKELAKFIAAKGLVSTEN